MTAKEFRTMALSLPETTEAAHMRHPDLRVSGKIFATLGYPNKSWGMVKVTRKQQAKLVDAEPEVFMPAKGAWGRQGATIVHLRIASKHAVRKAIEAAWGNIASKRLSSRVQGHAL